MRGSHGDRVGTYIKTVKLGDAVLCDKLRNCGIPLRHPSKELGNTHGCCCYYCLVIAENRWQGGYATVVFAVGRGELDRKADKKKKSNSEERRAKALRGERAERMGRRFSTLGSSKRASLDDRGNGYTDGECQACGALTT